MIKELIVIGVVAMLPIMGLGYMQNQIDEMEEAGLIQVDTMGANERLCHERAEKIGYTLPEYKRHGGGLFSNPEIECWAVNKEGEPVQLW